MLNRRILRIKAFKVLYGAVFTRDSQNPPELKDLEAALGQSCEATRDLYMLMLGTIVPLTDLARQRIESASRKINKTEAEKNPNTKFADNALAALFREDEVFGKLFKKRFPKFDWGQYDLIFKSMLNDIALKDWYREYMESPDRSLAGDVRLFIHIFEEEFVDNDDIAAILEDMSLLWNDDLAYALSCCCRSLELISRGGRWTLPPLYQSDTLSLEGRKVESDRDFSLKLLRCSYAAYGKYSDLLSSLVSSFEKDRLVSTDVCLMVCCLAEVMNFDSIPARVSINEYVEISKFYGTPKSSVFVNGLLDRAVRKLLSESGSTKTL